MQIPRVEAWSYYSGGIGSYLDDSEAMNCASKIGFTIRSFDQGFSRYPGLNLLALS